jgi:spore germination protein YaaH
MDEPAPPDPRARRVTTHRLTVLVLVLSLVVVGIGVARELGGDPAGRPPPRIDAWVPYWALDASLPELPRRARELTEVSPFWYSAVGVDTIVADPNRPVAATEQFVAAARRAGLAVVPSILDGMPAGGMAAILRDPATRARHVETIATFAAEGDFDGIDLDYEQFAFADPRSTWADTRPAWVAFVRELADRLHGDGRTVTVSIPPVYDAGRTATSGFWVYDHGAISPVVDRIRVMAYDYSTTTPGPIAPLEWVRQAVRGTVAAAGGPEKLALGIPLYGYNWAVGATGSCPADLDTGRVPVTTRSIDDLVARRGGAPAYDPGTGEWTYRYDLPTGVGEPECVQRREVHYVGVDGARARIELARAAGIPVVALWALGYDADAFWEPTAG